MLIKKISASNIVIAAALIGSQAAWAQETSASATAPAEAAPASADTQPNTTSVPLADPATQTADQASPAEPASPAPAEQAQVAPPQPARGGTQVAAFVDSQFPALDADRDGALTTIEFEGWIARLKTAELQSAGKPIDAREVKAYAQNALLSADRNSDKKVTRAEATQFFSGAA